MSFEGDELIVNADVAVDGLAIELVDAEGNVVQGAERDASHLMRQDALRYRVVWGDAKTFLRRRNT